MLKGADLASSVGIAFLERLPLITRDTGFDRYCKAIEIVIPERLYADLR